MCNYLFYFQFRTRIRRGPYRWSHVAAGTPENDPAEWYANKVHASKPTPYHVGRKLVFAVSKVLPALSGRG